MLIEFRATNYRSIGEEQILSLIPAAKQREYPQNIIPSGNHSSLNVIGIYGANGSGKSNLIQAMRLLDNLLYRSARAASTTPLPYDPFLLREGWVQRPTRFEIVFIVNQNKYRYGLEFDRTEVKTEWLFRKATGREVNLFQREGDVIEATSGLKGNDKLISAAIEATRPNSLFLSTCDMLNIQEAKDIFQWFRHFNVIDGLNTDREEITTVKMWETPSYREAINNYLDSLKLGFQNIEISTKDFETTDLPDEIDESTRRSLAAKLIGMKKYIVKATHSVYGEDGTESGNMLSWDFDDRESAGTKKAFQLSGPVIWVLIHGGTLVIDEIEARMHPIMTLHAINQFLNKETNPNNAQLIFATHDTNLLTYAPLRRDQIYFVEKNKWESTEIYSLSDFRYKDLKEETERPDTDKEKRYLEGRYGAIPMLGSFQLKN
jgi:predicted ATPase